MAADFDEPVFDDDFVRGATFTEPSARERLRPPSRREQRRIRRAARRARRSGGVSFLRRRGHREPSYRRSVVQLVGIIALLFAISFALWWWNRPPAEPEPVRPVFPTAPENPGGPQNPGGPGEPAPGPTGEVPEEEIPEV
ncbi:SCO2583/SCO2584 N-terminal domain-containing protein [Actinomadura livida]|uniref:Uncharacterized protein n=1 Tax=Actinomadura livida TaxID=79909 RepID=A0A7W7IHK8_9ACTN|nr:MULTISPECIES: hypothetical protein [Actinomadura]MBB4777091.1 hypothetical protein [Actinomadura catellatispora]GGU21778.1 hypothetical protein GCM10010208_53570 [Actinomadura livida]